MLNKYVYFVLAVLVGSVMMVSASAQTDYMQFGRYLTVTNRPSSNDQLDIKEIVRRQFPQRVKTVGGAVIYTLKNTGYQLVPTKRSTDSVRQLYKHPLPSYLRSVGPMPLENVLLALSGDAYQLVVDPVHRLITFRLRNDYQGL